MGAHTWHCFHTCPRFSFVHATSSPHCDVSYSRPGNILNGNILHVPLYAIPAFYLIWMVLAYEDGRVFFVFFFLPGRGGRVVFGWVVMVLMRISVEALEQEKVVGQWL